MESILRLLLSYWLLVIVIGVAVWLIPVSIYDRIHKDTRFDRSRGSQYHKLSRYLFRVGLAIVSLPFVAWFLTASWAYTTEATAHTPEAKIVFSPITATFQETEKFNTTVRIENNGEVPITELLITFPLVDGVVLDYLNASDPMEFKARSSSWLTGGNWHQYSTTVEIQPGDVWQMTIPIQLTDYGNINEDIQFTVISSQPTEIEPIGRFFTQPVTTRAFHKDALSWVILKNSEVQP